MISCNDDKCKILCYKKWESRCSNQALQHLEVVRKEAKTTWFSLLRAQERSSYSALCIMLENRKVIKMYAAYCYIGDDQMYVDNPSGTLYYYGSKNLYRGPVTNGSLPCGTGTHYLSNGIKYSCCVGEDIKKDMVITYPDGKVNIGGCRF
jgi:hypothetical protein